MLYKFLCVSLLMSCVISCSTGGTDDEHTVSIFPTPPAILEEKKSPDPDINIRVVNPRVIVEPFAEEAIVEPVIEIEPADDIAPRLINSTVHHGDISVDPDTDRFVFTFDEDIDATNFIKLIDNTTGLHMRWIPFIRDKEVELLKTEHGLQLIGEHVYTIEIRVADVARNWTQPGIITFVTEFINFAVEEQAIRDLYAVYAVAHGNKNVDTLRNIWFKSEDKNVFTTWTFWAGTFERNDGWKAVTVAWEGIFRLHGGEMAVDITSIAIDSQGKEALLRGTYKWGNQHGVLISALKKDGKDWKIRAIDYTGGKHGKQVKDLVDTAHIFKEIAKISFKDDIQPILAERCAIPGCHAAPGVAGLDLTQYDTFKRGGVNGKAFVSGNGNGSLVVKRIDGGGMPLIPPPLDANQIQLFIDWINEGAANN